MNVCTPLSTLSVLLLAGLPVLQERKSEDPVQKAIESFQSAMKELKPPIKPADRMANAAKALQGLDVATLSGEQIEALMLAGVAPAAPVELYEQFGVRLNTIAGQKDIAGAVAAGNAIAFAVTPSAPRATAEDREKLKKTQMEALLKASRHPALGDAIKAGKGLRVLEYCNVLKSEELAATGIYKTLAGFVTDGLPSSAAQSVLAFTGAANGSKTLDKATSDKLRATATALADKAIADPATNKSLLKYLENQKKHLNGAAGRGELIDHAAPAVKVLWSNSDAKGGFGDFKGNVILVDFWATWCGPCIASFPHMRELQERYKNSNVVILGVTSPQGYVYYPKATDPKEKMVKDLKVEDELGRMPEWIKTMEMTWKVIVTEENCFNPDFAVNGIPHIALIDSKGNVRFNGMHPSDTSIESKIDGLLTEAGLKVPPARPKAEESKDKEKENKGGGH